MRVIWVDNPPLKVENTVCNTKCNVGLSYSPTKRVDLYIHIEKNVINFFCFKIK